MKLKPIVTLLVAMGASSAAWALDNFTIKDIRVEGLERTEPATVFNYLPVRIGDVFTDATGESIIKSLYKTGFFEDVQVETKDDLVLLTVEERPVISDLNVEGAKTIGKNAITTSFARMGMEPSQIFDPQKFNQAIDALRQEFKKKGKVDVKIEPKITKLDRNRVSLLIDINEGETSVVRNIDFVGNKVFSASTLRSHIKTSSSGMFSWLTKDDRLADEVLEQDKHRLREFYQDNGYAVARVSDARVKPNAEHPNDHDVEFTIDEGPRFRMGDIVIPGGNREVPMDELTRLITTKKGDWYDRSKVKKVVDAVRDKMGDYGYAMAEVVPEPRFDEQRGRIDFTLDIIPNNKTYVRQINIMGNNKTRDEVIRREFRQMESAPFNRKLIARSKERLELLGFFDAVAIEPVPVIGAPDQTDLNVTVIERKTGSLDLSLGYVQDQGIVVAGGFAQDNLFGTGKSMNARISTGSSQKIASVSFTDPYFTKDNASLGYDLFWRTYDPNKIDITSYKSRTYGGGLRLGVPVTEYDRVNLGLGVNNLKLTLFPYSPKRYYDFVEKYGQENWTITGNLGWGRNTTDSSLWPTKGYIVNLNLESGLPGGNIQYWKVTHHADMFFPLSDNFTMRLGGQVGVASGYGRTSELPFFHNFYNGGLGFVRGFDNSSLGPKIYSRLNEVDYLGGTREAAATAELLFPMPGMKERRSVRLSLFADAGSVWDGQTYKVKDQSNPYYKEDHVSTFENELRYSAGLALTWLSPIGAIKLSYAWPIKQKDGDKIRNFQFQLGTVF